MLSRSFLSVILCCIGVLNAHAQEITLPNSNANTPDAIVAGLEEGSILVCKAGQCVQTNNRMNGEYLYNQLSALATENIGQYIDICEGNPATRRCIQKNITFPIHSAVIRTNASLAKARLVEARTVENVPGMDLIIDYQVRAGDTFPRCQAALSRMGTVHAGSADMMSPKFSCRLTETGDTIFSIAYHIDYLDFDQGVIGALYTIAADQTFTGGGSGYILLDLKKGVKMAGDETFPYPEQLAALLSGEVATFDTPADIEAVWMKPTPFLNLLTPQFAPNNCNTFAEGCSAQMLNNPALAVPSAQAKLDQLTPPNVAHTTGLIEQKIAYEQVSPTERKTIMTKKIISENGTPIYSEAQTRHFVRETPDAELIEDTSKAQKQTEGTEPQKLSERLVQNAEKEYAAMKQFEAQTQALQKGNTATAPTPISAIPATTPVSAIPSTTTTSGTGSDTTVSATQQIPQQNPASNPSVTQATAASTTPSTVGIPAKPSTQTNIEIIVPEGVALSEAERAYIEQLALPPEVMGGQPSQAQGQQIGALNPQAQTVSTNIEQQGMPRTAADQTMPIAQNGLPIVSADQGYARPLEASTSIPTIQPHQPVSIKASPEPIKKEQKSLWDKVSRYFYF